MSRCLHVCKVGSHGDEDMGRWKVYLRAQLYLHAHVLDLACWISLHIAVCAHVYVYQIVTDCVSHCLSVCRSVGPSCLSGHACMHVRGYVKPENP